MKKQILFPIMAFTLIMFTNEADASFVRKLKVSTADSTSVGGFNIHKEAMWKSYMSSSASSSPLPLDLSLVEVLPVEVSTTQVTSLVTPKPVVPVSSIPPTTSTTIQVLSPIERAIMEIGSLEGEDAYSVGGFYCGRFVAYVLNLGDERIATDGPSTYTWDHAVIQPSEVVPGDVVTVDLMGKGQQATHIGIVERIEGDSVYTIEGNTLNEAGQPSVNRKERKLGDGYILAFYHGSN